MPSDRATDQEHRPDEVHRAEADAPREALVRQLDLRERLERLPSEHPSSPSSSHRSGKPSSANLADLELPFPEGRGDDATDQAAPSDDPLRPLTDDEFAEHVREVRARLDEAYADGLTTQEQHTVPGTNYEIWSADRTAIHDAIIDDLYERAADVPNEHPAIIAGGLPGAGKSTVLQGHAEIDRSHFLTIDPDEIKAELAKRDLIPYLENLSPMEASGLVHEESSHIAKALAQRAYADGKNIVWDITMSSRRSTEGRIDSLRAAGYTHVDGIFVDISIATSLARAESRHRIGQEQYRAGRGQGGRFVAPEVIEAKVDQEWGSVNRKTFEEVKHRFDGWTIYDNSADDFSPVLIDSDNERRPGG